MKLNPAFLAITASLFLGGCGGGGDSTPKPGGTFQATQGVFVVGGFANSFGAIDQYFQIVLDDGETWMVKEYNARGEPLFFANGKFRFSEKVTTTVSGSTTTTTTTVTPERTVTESNTVTTDPATPEASQSITRFRSDDSVISINSNVLGAAPVTYAETTERNIPIANSFESVGTSSFRERVGTVTPEVGRPAFTGVRIGLDPSSIFAYARPAELQRLEGSWRFALGRVDSSMTLSSTGGLTGANAVTGCAFNGRLMPHPNGKNIFLANITVTNCPDAGSYSGVSAIYPQLDAQNLAGEPVPAIFLAATNTSKTRVFSFAMFRVQN